MSDFVLSDEEQAAVDKGEAASFLLDHPLFLEAIEAVRANAAEAILTSCPGETEVRESNYHLSRGLTEITVALMSLSAAGKGILATHEARRTPGPEEELADDVHTY